MRLFNFFKKKDPRNPLLGKILPIIVAAGTVFLGLKIWNLIAPTVLEAAKNFWLFVAMVVPAAVLIGWVAMNRKLCYMWYLGMCKKMTAFFIKMDPISIMDGYLALLKMKYKNLSVTLLFLNGNKIQLGRLIKSKEDEYDGFQRIALAAKQQGQMLVAQESASNALACSDSIKLYTPIFQKYENSTSYLTEVSDNWDSCIKTLAYKIDSKKEEAKTLKYMVRGLKSIEDFISSDSPEAQAFGLSMKALEEDVCQNLSYINDWEEKAKPIMATIRVQKQANQNDALALLEKMANDSNLKLPNYTNFTATNQPVQDIAHEEVQDKYGFGK